MKQDEHAAIRKQIAELLGCSPRHVSVQMSAKGLAIEAPYVGDIHASQVQAVRQVIREARGKTRAA